jgi:hypothetical protein
MKNRNRKGTSFVNDLTDTPITVRTEDQGQKSRLTQNIRNAAKTLGVGIEITSLNNGFKVRRIG